MYVISKILQKRSKKNKIPDNVLTDILRIYEFGVSGHLKTIPNNIICDTDGSFWTTWNKILEIRSEIKQQKGGENGHSIRD